MRAGHPLIIAIDGPAGSGKSTIAARLAQKLGYMNLESGAMYRALALKALQDQVSPDDPVALRRLADQTVIKLAPLPDGNRVLLDGQDVSQRIREADVTLAASRVSVHPSVREVMVQRQREMGARGGVVMEGRDIGTAVFPNADVKIFLDADPEVRSQRRYEQIESAPANAGVAPESVLKEIRERDQRDRGRAESPLVQAPDAIYLDTTGLTIEEVEAAILKIIRDRTSNGRERTQ